MAGAVDAGAIHGSYFGAELKEPLGTYDMNLWQAKDFLEAHDVRFEPGLNEDLAASPGSKALINLASNEYYGAVQPDRIDARIVSPAFLDAKDGGEPKIVSFFAKKARGQMARFIIDNGLNEPEGLKKFKVDGYRYNRGESTARELVFTRDKPPGA